MADASPSRDAAAPRTVLEVLRASERWLGERDVDAPRRSAELLLAGVLGLSRMQLYLAHDRPLDAAELTGMRALLRRRGTGEPVAYLLGEVGFGDLLLRVDRRVLVPRPETEGLVELSASRLPRAASVLELGTGSGAIALWLAQRRPDLVITATDISGDALAVARANAERLGLSGRIEWCEGSWLEPVRGRRFGGLLCNPPYVDPARDDLVEPAVRAHEPAVALFAAAGDPASCYRTIAAGMTDHLVPGAPCLFEVGVEAATDAKDILVATPGLTDVELLPDLAGLPRYLTARVADG